MSPSSPPIHTLLLPPPPSSPFLIEELTLLPSIPLTNDSSGVLPSPLTQQSDGVMENPSSNTKNNHNSSVFVSSGDREYRRTIEDILRDEEGEEDDLGDIESDITLQDTPETEIQQIRTGEVDRGGLGGSGYSVTPISLFGSTAFNKGPLLSVGDEDGYGDVDVLINTPSVETSHPRALLTAQRSGPQTHQWASTAPLSEAEYEALR
jgi:hypothetical protein